MKYVIYSPAHQAWIANPTGDELTIHPEVAHRFTREEADAALKRLPYGYEREPVGT